MIALLPTGGGKTLLYSFDILQALNQNSTHTYSDPISGANGSLGPKGTVFPVVVVTPLINLVEDQRGQVAGFVAKLGGGAIITTVTGSKEDASKQKHKQIQIAHADIIITTPQGILEHKVRSTKCAQSREDLA